MPIPDRVPKPELADFVGLSVRRIEQLTNAKLIPQPEGGRYPFGATVRAILRYKHATREGEDADQAISDQARLLKAQADKAEMEANRLRQELVSAAEVAAAGEHLMSALRDRLLAIPNACAESAAEAAASGGPRKVAEVVRQQIHGAMGELSAAEVAGTA